MHVHLIGIGGTAMTALARLLGDLGHRVTGSDENVYPPMSQELERMGMAVRTPYAPANLDPRPDLVVVGNAIARGNPELEEALDRGLPYTSQAEAIEDLVLPGRLPVVVTGTHGKTTTTSLTAHLLATAGLDPGWFIGGLPQDLPAPSALGGGRTMVLEGDEYDTAYFDKRPKFHHYRPRILIVNNVEFDHADIYADLQAIELEFRRLVNTVPRNGLILVGSDSPAALRVVAAARAPVRRFGLDPGDTLRAARIEPDGAGMRFEVWRDRELLGEGRLGVAGEFNVRNALAALGAALELGVPVATALPALGSFRGVRRRLECRGIRDGVEVYDDFAHHPTAIAASIRALRGKGVKGRLFAVLEPRSWSMRRNVHQQALAPALALAEVVVMAPVFEPHRLPAGTALDVPRVLEEARARGRQAHQIEDSGDLARLVAVEARPGDVILIMSNGGFDAAHDKVLAALDERAGARPPAGRQI